MHFDKFSDKTWFSLSSLFISNPKENMMSVNLEVVHQIAKFGKISAAGIESASA